MTSPMLRPRTWWDSFREVTVIELTDEQRARMQKGQPRTNDDEWERDESGVLRIVHRDRVTLIGPASLIVLRDGLKSLDDWPEKKLDKDKNATLVVHSTCFDAVKGKVQVNGWTKDAKLIYYSPSAKSNYNGLAGAYVQVGDRITLGGYQTSPDGEPAVPTQR